MALWQEAADLAAEEGRDFGRFIIWDDNAPIRFKRPPKLEELEL